MMPLDLMFGWDSCCSRGDDVSMSSTGFNDGGGVVLSEYEIKRREAAMVLSSSRFMKKWTKTSGRGRMKLRRTLKFFYALLLLVIL